MEVLHSKENYNLDEVVIELKSFILSKIQLISSKLNVITASSNLSRYLRECNLFAIKVFNFILKIENNQSYVIELFLLFRLTFEKHQLSLIIFIWVFENSKMLPFKYYVFIFFKFNEDFELISINFYFIE